MAAFTAVAAGVGLAVTAATTTASFVQMAEEKEKKKKAEEAAAASMMEARKKLDVNYYEQLGIQKEPYELARREMLAQGAMATEALREGDPRALAAGVGRVQLAQQAGQEKVATAMQQEQSQLDKLVAGEDSRLRDLQTQLDLQEVVGAQQAMADAARAEQMALQQGLAGVTSMAGQVASMAPLYSKSPEVNALNRIKTQAARKGIDVSTLNMSDPASLKAAGINLTNKQLASIPSNVSTFADFEAYVTPKYNQITKSPKDSGWSNMGQAQEYIEPVITPADEVFSIPNNPFYITPPKTQGGAFNPVDPTGHLYRSPIQPNQQQIYDPNYNPYDPFGYLYKK